MVSQTRCCAECGGEFTWTSRSPNRRFCSPPCKARWWRKYHRRAAARANGGAPGAEGPAPRAAEQATLGTAHSCPNCGQQLTVVNLVVSVDDAPEAGDGLPRARVLATDRG